MRGTVEVALPQVPGEDLVYIIAISTRLEPGDWRPGNAATRLGSKLGVAVLRGSEAHVEHRLTIEWVPGDKVNTSRTN